MRNRSREQNPEKWRLHFFVEGAQLVALTTIQKVQFFQLGSLVSPMQCTVCGKLGAVFNFDELPNFKLRPANKVEIRTSTADE